jgi:hypothetical protein
LLGGDGRTYLTVTLLTALLSLLGFLTGLWGATYLQDRETRRRHLGIARALRAEVARIQRESGGKGEELIPITFLGMRAAVPKLSLWVPHILTDIASSSPEVVERFLDLERFLDTLRHTDAATVLVEEELSSRRDVAKDAEATFEKAELDSIGEALVAEMTAKRDVERMEDSAELAHFSARTAYKNLQRTLDQLDDILSGLETTLALGPWTHLPWRRRLTA